MIPSIKKRIDEASNGEGDRERIRIPSSELAALGEMRRVEYNQRIREELNSQISEMDEAADKADGDPVDEQREYGLPLGEACHDIWDLIFQQIDNMDDIANLRDTCALFRELLDRKYTTLRFIQIGMKFAKKFGGFTFLLNLRLVCKTSKIFVDKFLSEGKLQHNMNLEPFDPDEDEHFVRKIGFQFQPQEQALGARLTASLQLLQVDPHNFPIKMMSVVEINEDDVNNRNVQFHEMVHNPLLPTLRTNFQTFLELVGRSVRAFRYISIIDRLSAYNQIRPWLSLMPNLEVMFVQAPGELINVNPNPGNPPALDLDVLPFPSCPRLKRYVHSATGFSPPFLEQIFHANPWINDVFIYHFSAMMDVGEEDITATLEVMNTVQLARFKLLGVNTIPSYQFLEFRAEWPLKSLSLMISGQDEEDRETPSRDLFAFINTFKSTLEELQVNWKIRDNGGFLDVPKVFKLCWKLWPNFKTFDFMVVLENLRYLDVDMEACQEINESFESVQMFFDESNLPPVYPALKRIRTRREAAGKWLQLWKA